MKSVILAAGLGTRLICQPKHNQRKCCRFITILLSRMLCRKQFIRNRWHSNSCGRNKTSIEDHFDKSYELEHTLQKSGKDRVLKQVRKITYLDDVYYM